MRKFIVSIFLILSFCVPQKITLNCPASTEYKRFEGRRFNLEIEIKEKAFIALADLFENPPQFEIKRCFIKFMESKGFLYDDSLYDYFIEMMVDTFGINYEIPITMAILTGLRFVGSVFILGGLVGFIWAPAAENSIEYKDAIERASWMLKIGAALFAPSLISQLFIKYKYKGVLSADIQIYSKNKKIFEKYYHIILHKKSQSRNISNTSFLSFYFSEILNKFFSDFEKDLNQKVIKD